MKVVDLRGLNGDPVVGPEQGATRLFIWCVTEPAGEVLGPHFHLGEELFRVLSGRVQFLVGDSQREVGPGEVIIIPPGTVHGHTVIEDAELEVLGEIASGVFITVEELDGTSREQEVFVRGVPWSRVPEGPSQYISREEQLRRFRSSDHVILTNRSSPGPQFPTV
jgi:quercetin dioxygenase-like cupin family protein